MAPSKISASARLLTQKKIQLKSRLCKFLGISLVSPRGDSPILISRFLKLYLSTSDISHDFVNKLKKIKN